MGSLIDGHKVQKQPCIELHSITSSIFVFIHLLNLSVFAVKSNGLVRTLLLSDS